MNPATEQRRLKTAEWQPIPRDWLPAAEIRRIEAMIAKHAPEKARILAEEKLPGRPPKA